MKNNGTYSGGEGYDRIFRALGDPHRIRIIRLLKEKELSAGEILSAVDVVQSTLSHHMKTLSESGVVNAVRQGKWTYYSLNEAILSDAAAFLEEYAKGTAQRKVRTQHQASAAVMDPVPVKEPEDRSGMIPPAPKEPALSAEHIPSAGHMQNDAAIPSFQEPVRTPETRKKKDKEKKGKKNKKNKK